MSHIFVSYSHKDKKYAHKLQETLQREGFEVWIDDRIDYGEEWPIIIQDRLDECGAFILIATENSYRSKWVQKEVTRAQRIGKPFFPLLLSGHPWLTIETTQYVDVRNKSLPTEKFYENLARVTPRKKVETIIPPPPPKKLLISKDAVTRFVSKLFPLIRFSGILLVIGVILWGGSLVIPTLISLISTAKATATLTLTPEPITPTKRITPTDTLLPTEITDAKGMSMMFVPAGDFTMGSDKGFSSERPAHKVYLDAYYIDKYEVTNALYKACVEEGVCKRPYDTSKYYKLARQDYPVVTVNWDMANVYCQWRGTQLPTEAQWEKAARGTDERNYPWGETILIQYANYDGSDAKNVGSYLFVKSPYGVFDMTGNVSEWVSDWYSPEYYQALLYNNPTGPLVSPYQPSHNFYGRVFRGGSWRTTLSSQLSTTYRYRLDPSKYADDLGFRCAKNATQ